MKRVILLVACLACGSKSKSEPTGWAVGTYIGGGSMLTGPSSCTYQAAAGVLEDGDKVVPMSKVTGEGQITETCGDTKRTIDAVKPTRIAIDGPDSVKAGATSDTFRVTVYADKRGLDGVHQGGESPDWQLDPGCAGVADFGPVLGAQDTGGKDITRTLVAAKAGSCTVKASILGLSTTKTVTIK